MSVSLYLKALKVLFIFYARIGLWISPIFWETKSKIVFLNPAAFIIEMVRMGKNFSFISDLRILVVIAAVGMAILVSRLLSFHEIRRKLTVDYFRML
jgi:ABC-type polysaccharide/polyol phosphate export permease